MKVLLLQDVYNLGRAGDVKKVANGYGRNYLMPQGLAVLATPGALKQAEHIRTKATEQRAILNKEMGVIAEKLVGVSLTFPARASETGKLYGSITSQMVADALTEKLGLEITRRQLDMQPLRTLGEHIIHVRLTMDMIPEVKVIIHREGEAIPEPVLDEETAATTEVEEGVDAAETPETGDTAETTVPDETMASAETIIEGSTEVAEDSESEKTEEVVEG